MHTQLKWQVRKLPNAFKSHEKIQMRKSMSNCECKLEKFEARGLKQERNKTADLKKKVERVEIK